MNQVQEIEGAVETSAVNNTLSFYGNILLTFSQEKSIIALDHIVVVWIGRSYEHGAFQKA